MRDRAREYADELAARWPNSRVVFASKAFPCTAVQRLVVEEGLGLDVAGGGEIITALKAGVDPALIVLHGNAKSDEEIALAVEHGIGLVAVDNADDVDRLEATVPAGRSQPVLVRVIPGVTADTHSHVLTGHEGSKFGLAPAAAAQLIKRIEASPRLDMRGLHVHVGSQILDVEPFAESVAPVAALGEFPVYDLGGGLGARYTWADRPPSVPDYLDALIGAAREHLPAAAEIIIEPGRSMVAEAATTVYRVTTVKRGAHTFVAVDGGMGDNLEVALFEQRFEAGIVGRFDGPDQEQVIVVGRHCESGDVLVDGVPLARPKVGDLLAVPATGAYCYTMANNYNGNRRIPVVFARDGAARLVVRRETYADLMARDVPVVGSVRTPRPRVTDSLRSVSSTSTVSCGARDRTAACRPSPARMRCPPKRSTRSPALSPAFSAALPGSTLRMRAPEMFGSSPTLTPSWARVALPVRSSSSATRLAWLTGIEKPTPIDPPSAPVVAIAELMPISWPCMSTSGPPELPGLIAASVCSAFSTVESFATRSPPTLTGRLIALMIPVVTVPPSPSGEPNATTCWPTRTAVGVAELDRGQPGRRCARAARRGRTPDRDRRSPRARCSRPGRRR